LPRADFPWLLTQLEDHGIINIPDVAAIPNEQADERDFLLLQSIQSLLIFPIIDVDKVTGFLGIDLVKRSCDWPEEEVRLLQLMIENISRALSRRSIEAQLTHLNEQFRAFAKHVPLGLFRFCHPASGDDYFEYWNPQFLELNAVTEPIAVLDFKAMHPEDRGPFLEQKALAIAAKVPLLWEGRYVVGANERWVRIEASPPIQNAQGVWIWSGFMQDITSRKDLELNLVELSQTDDLTGLTNRRHFFDQAEATLALSKRYQHSFSVLMLDIDHFKRINDQFGHAAGDTVLRKFAQVMQALVRRTDLTSRLGGEEFAILLPESRVPDAMTLAERIRTRIAAEPFRYETEQFAVTVSIGVANYRPNDEKFERILARADQALYRAKSLGRNRIEIAS
jgi:diguanylate cyclase (GGDEF)-like protein